MSKAAAQRRHNPLEDDITSSGGPLRTKSITGKRKSRSDEDGPNKVSDGYVDARSSRKILAIAQDLADEDAAESRAKAKAVDASPGAFGFDSRFGEDEQDKDDAETQTRQEEEDWFPEEDIEAENVDPNDLAVYKKFLNEGGEFADFAPSMAGLTTGESQPRNNAESIPGSVEGQEGESTNLADLILQRIAEKEAQEVGQHGAVPDEHFDPPEGAVEIPVRSC